MGILSSLFGGDDEARIRSLFATDALSSVAWKEEVAAVAGNSSMVDVVVTSAKRSLVLAGSDKHTIGLTYWPDGPVVRGVQDYQEGQTLTFSNVMVKPGGTLAVVTGKGGTFHDLPAIAVDVRPVGGALGSGSAGRSDQFSDPKDDPLSGLLDKAGIGVAIVIVMLGVVLLIEVKK